MATMSETLAQTFVVGLTAYAGIGLLFASVFVVAGVQRLDSDSHGSSIGFRLLILPGVAAFWPMFLRRWVSGVTEPPVEKNPHR